MITWKHFKVQWAKGDGDISCVISEYLTQFFFEGGNEKGVQFRIGEIKMLGPLTRLCFLSSHLYLYSLESEGNGVLCYGY